MMIITPDIVSSFIKFRVCDASNDFKPLTEHKQILEHIINQEADEACKAMELHLKDVSNFSKNMDQSKNNSV